MTDILTQPMTDHERSLILAGIEWMRAAAVAAIAADMDGRSFPGQLALMDVTAIVEAITPPTLTPARLGILGEG